jgi:hypothetical protein
MPEVRPSLMTIHYHGTPITPLTALKQLAGRHYCVSHWRPEQVKLAHDLAQSVMLDNGAFSAWKAGKPILDWKPYLAWADEWLDYPTTWAVIPDVVQGGEEEQEALIAQWPFGSRGAPVWHLHESIDRLLRLLDQWPRVCMGSSEEFKDVLSPIWERRMDHAWREIGRRHSRTPWVHMLRGMQLTRHRWPFASVDSTDIARNHSRPQNTPLAMVERWDAAQCPPRYSDRGEQGVLAA